MWPNRRGGLLTAVLALTVLFAVACGSSEDDKSKATTTTGGGQAAATAAAGATQAAGQASPAATQAAAYTPAAKDQQVLRVQYAEPDFFDPHKSQFSQDIGVQRHLFRPLFATDDKGNPTAEVAAQLPTKENGGFSADGKTVTIKIKDGQKWSDGSALTAKDFEYSLKRTFNPKLAGPYASFLFNIVGAEEYYGALGTKDKPKTPSNDELNKLRDAVGVKAVDDKTLQVNLKEPQGTILILLGLWNTYPVKQSVVEASGGPENSDWAKPGKLIGNGPFVLKEYKEKDRIIIEANPQYTLEPKPKLSRVEFRLIDDAEIAFNAFQTGELDYSNVPASKVPVVDADANLKKLNIRAAEPTTIGIEFNHSVKPLDNVKVRQAFAQAIDRDAYVKVIRAGVNKPTLCWMPAGVPGSVEADCAAQKYDVASAKKALADAGFPNGQGFPKLKFLASNTATGKNQAEFFQKQLKDNLNIDIDIELVDSKTRSSRYSNSQFELFYGGWHEDYHDPENWLPELFGTGGGNNQDKYSNSKFDDLMKQAKFELNNEKRIDLYRQGHKILMDDFARVNVENTTANVVVKSKVKNLIPNGQDSGFTGNFNLLKIEIAKE